MSARASRPEADARADCPSTYQPTPYDAYLTDDPEATWDEIQAEPGPEADVLLCPSPAARFLPSPTCRHTKKGTTCDHSQHPARPRAL